MLETTTDDLIVVCPKCDAPQGKPCSMRSGAVARMHLARTQRAHHQRQSEKSADLIVACPDCHAEKGEPCARMINGLTHVKRTKEATAARSAGLVTVEEAAPAKAKKPKESVVVDVLAPRTNTRCPTCRTGTVTGFQIVCEECANAHPR